MAPPDTLAALRAVRARIGAFKALCLCFAHPLDDADIWAAQLANVTRLFHAARRNGLELLLEVISSKLGPVDDATTPRVIQRVYDAGTFPDWCKLEPFKTAECWAAVVAAIERNDPRTRGIVVLGLDAAEDDLATAFRLAAAQPLVKGFAVGRTMFGAVALDWMAGQVTDAQAVDSMQQTFARLCTLWDSARTGETP